MLEVRSHLLEEVLNGAITRRLFTKPFGPYSESWYRKELIQSQSPIDPKKVKKKLVGRWGRMFPQAEGRLVSLDIDGAHELAVLPDLNVEMFETMGEGVAPLAAYFSRDLSHPFEVGVLEPTHDHLKYTLDRFPYCHWWQVTETDLKANGASVEQFIDAALACFACMVIDAELAMDLDEAIDLILIPGLQIEYSPNYGVIHYVQHKVESVKAAPEYSLEKLYEAWASWDDAPDKDSIRRLIRRWRSGASNPSPARFLDFIYLLSGTSARKFSNECEIVGLFHVPQLIQRYRRSKSGNTALLTSDSFYRERVRFWHSKLTEHYADVLAQRAKEVEQEQGGPG